MPRRISERKRYPDGRLLTFDCVLLRRRPGVVAVRFDHVGDAAGRYGVPPGSWTVGCFWAGRDYNLYRIRDPAGRRLRERFDVIRDCRITDDAVEYEDLFLDLLIDGSGRAVAEDEDELEAAVSSGLVTPGARDRALRTLRDLASGGYRRVIAEAEALWPAAQRE